MTTIELLKPFIDDQYGDEVPDPEARVAAFRGVVPGHLPDDYATTLQWLRKTTGLKNNQILSIESPRPREPGMFEYIGSNPPLDMLYGLQENHENVFKLWRWLANRMPPGLVPIGDDGSSNEICIDVSEAGNGRIYHWFHVGDPGPNDAHGRPGWGNTFLLANSFTDLCRRLRPAPPLPDDMPVGKICFVQR